MVPPDIFIPILEKDPLFSDLGEWILRTALKDAIPFLGVYPDFTINVNLSYTQLEKPDFTDMVYRVLEEMSFPPDHLCLEITERCRVLEPDLLKSVIVKLRGRGIKVALDDFGTGFSAMGLIKDIPFDVIKIDRSFVKNVVKSSRERALIERLALRVVTNLMPINLHAIVILAHLHQFLGSLLFRPCCQIVLHLTDGPTDIACP